MLCSTVIMPLKSEKKIKMGEEGNLLWTNDKIEHLLDTVRDFKAEKEHKAIDWESIKDNYERIKGSLEIFLMVRKGRNTHMALHFVLHKNVLHAK